MFLPMSCTSPFTVATTTVPCMPLPLFSPSMSGSRCPTAHFTARQLQQLRPDVLVEDELAGVDDAHVEAGADRVVEECRVHRLAHHGVPAEGEAEVRDPAARLHTGAALLDQRQRLDERLRELVVLRD